MAKPSRIGYINISGLELPVHFFFEMRSSTRVSLGKKAVLVRLPHLMRGPLLKKEILWVKNWLEKTYQQKPDHFIRLARKQTPFVDGEMLSLFDAEVQLHINHIGEDQRSSARMRDGHIYLRLPAQTTRASAVSLVSRVLAKKYLPYFDQKVRKFNDTFFQKEVRSVRLKYNSSNWGSCSSQGNINLSTRLLLTPVDVQDYIIVHELSHLIEMNHSPRFWQVVESVMPNYAVQERWLKEHGALRDF